jgi:hypothetical protein
MKYLSILIIALSLFTGCCKDDNGSNPAPDQNVKLELYAYWQTSSGLGGSYEVIDTINIVRNSSKLDTVICIKTDGTYNPDRKAEINILNYKSIQENNIIITHSVFKDRKVFIQNNKFSGSGQYGMAVASGYLIELQ